MLVCDVVVDGVFVYVVKIIGVYCCLSFLVCWFRCENVEFFVIVEVVEVVGYWFSWCVVGDCSLVVE